MSRCASDCGRSTCSRCTARAARRTRWRPTGTRARRSWRRSASSPAPSCGACTRRSSARIPASTRRRRSTRASCRRSSTRRRRWSGREAELEWLRGHWRRALAGAGRLVLVAGERGIGKTRLVAELAAEVLRERRRGAYGSAAARARRWPPLASAADRRCWCSTTSPARPAAESRRASSPAWRTRPVLVVATAEHVAPAARCGRRDADPGAAERRRRARARPPLCGRAEDVDVPVERLLAASGGVPAVLHGAASEWARSWSCAASPHSVGRIAADRPGCVPPRTTSSGASSSCRPPRSAPSRTRARPETRLSARSRASRPSRPATRASSSGASGWWPRWSRG